MIISKKPLAISEVMEYVKDEEGKEELLKYLKKFGKASKEKSKIRESILAMNNPKIKESDIVKIIDFLPQSQEEVNKIFTEVSLSEEEIKSIIDLVNK